MTVNAGRYSEKLIKLRRTIQIRRRGLLSSGVVLLHDYALSHVAGKTENDDMLKDTVTNCQAAEIFDNGIRPKELMVIRRSK
ncbi:hypothetical protein J6590_080498 [Homalodisca vitripennis]|nr:hypothetical protein J6590_080498 [Homalodisca vitripennis]